MHRTAGRQQTLHDFTQHLQEVIHEEDEPLRT